MLFKLDALDVALPAMAAQALTCAAALGSSLAAVLFATPLALPVVSLYSQEIHYLSP